MNFAWKLIDFILHIGDHLASIIADYGNATYAVIFAIIFLETGFVITPFLPGDSLIFAAGTIAAQGLLSPELLWLIMVVAAIAGDAMNYWIGYRIGPRIFSSKQRRFLNEEQLLKTQAFYERHGGKTIIIARFLPFVRTFAPFVAGIGKMRYGHFLAYNIVGAVVWVTLFLLAGYFFGNLPFVQDNFSYIILGIIVISVLPGVVKFMKRSSSTKEAGNIPPPNTSSL